MTLPGSSPLDDPIPTMNSPASPGSFQLATSYSGRELRCWLQKAQVGATLVVLYHGRATTTALYAISPILTDLQPPMEIQMPTTFATGCECGRKIARHGILNAIARPQCGCGLAGLSRRGAV
ncbi:hypothetical protein IG631_22186 [Alternaria alternata]|nr:hypothetical protein IG631_22186 [Alternaria alternata]